MDNVRQLLRSKGQHVWSVTPEATVLDALRVLADKEVGALVVLEGERLAGILSERDIVRNIAQNGSCRLDAPVTNLMTSTVIVVSPEETIEACMALMSARHIRHLPVIENDRLVGVVSIRDVVKEAIENREDTIHNLKNYIYGGS